MWSTVLKPNPSLWGEIDRLPTEDVLKHRMLKSLIRECGIPEPLRKKFWPIISGANDLKTGSRVVYADIVNTLRQYKNESSDQIEKDLNRSFPGHPYFDSPQGMKSLRNVLTAFSWLNPAIGYTQSMNFWAGLMLLFVLSEETVFWLVVTVVERILPQQYYDNSMLDIIVDNQVMFYLLEIYLPRVYQHISQYTTDLSPILTQWFLCLFVNTLPTELTLRLLDVLLYEGNKVLFRAALGIFKCYESEILKTESFEDLFVLIAKPVKIQDVNGFMTLIFDRIWLRAFGRDKISVLREGIKKATIRAEQEKDQLRQLREAARLMRATQEAQAHSQQATSSVEASSSIPTSKSPPTASSILPNNTQASSSTSETTLPHPSYSPDPRRKTIRASMLPEEVKTVIDRKSWRAYKRSDEWHMIEEYFSVLDAQSGSLVISPPNSDQRVPLSVSEPEGVPKASKTKHYKATTLSGAPATLTRNADFPATGQPAAVDTSQKADASSSGNNAVAGQPKRRSYAEVAKGNEVATSSQASAAPSGTYATSHRDAKASADASQHLATSRQSIFGDSTTVRASPSTPSVATASPGKGQPTSRPPYGTHTQGNPLAKATGAAPKKMASPPSASPSGSTSRSGFNTVGKAVSNWMSSFRSPKSDSSTSPSSSATSSTSPSTTQNHTFHKPGTYTAKQSPKMTKATSQAHVLPSGPSVPSSSLGRPKLTHAISSTSTTTPVPKFTAAISQNPRLTATDSSES